MNKLRYGKVKKAHGSKLRKWAKYGGHDDVQSKQVNNRHTNSYWQLCFYDVQDVPDDMSKPLPFEDRACMRKAPSLPPFESRSHCLLAFSEKALSLFFQTPKSNTTTLMDYTKNNVQYLWSESISYSEYISDRDFLFLLQQFESIELVISRSCSFAISINVGSDIACLRRSSMCLTLSFKDFIKASPLSHSFKLSKTAP